MVCQWKRSKHCAKYLGRIVLDPVDVRDCDLAEAAIDDEEGVTGVRLLGVDVDIDIYARGDEPTAHTVTFRWTPKRHAEEEYYEVELPPGEAREDMYAAIEAVVESTD